MKRLRLLTASALLALVGCSDPEDEARKRLAMVKNAHGSPAEICHEARAIQAAALAKGDPQHFSEVHTEADIDCFDNDHGYDQRYDGVQADNMDALPDNTTTSPPAAAPLAPSGTSAPMDGE